MANTLNTVSGTLIAQQALSTLLENLPMLRQITTDFGVGTALYNQAVTTHIVTAGSADDYSTTTGYVPANRTQTDVTVTLNKHKHHTFAINDQERSQTTIDLINRFAPTAAHALGKQICDDLFALVLAANFTNVTTVSAASFGRDDVIDIGTALNGAEVPLPGRFMILAPEHYGALFKDTSIVSSDFRGGNDVVSGRVGLPIHGFDVSEYSGLPANGQNLVGIAATRESLALVTRIPELPQERDGGMLQVVTEPNTGLSVLLRQFYNWRLGQEEYGMTLIYGVAVGNSTCLRRIASA